MSTESWNGPVNANNAEFLSLWIDGKMFGSPMYMHMQNLNESTIWNVNVNYSTYSTLLLPYVKPGNTVILTKAEKILNFIIPFVWTGLFLLVTTRKFKWSSR
jgi:hypothetical protein